MPFLEGIPKTTRGTISPRKRMIAHPFLAVNTEVVPPVAAAAGG